MFTPRDDRFHFEEMGDRWWMTETSWFSFYNVERQLGGWLYTLTRPNIGTVQGGCWVWDASAALPWEILYNANYASMRLPRDADLDDITFPTGVSIKVLEPGASYALGFEDAPRIDLRLRFDGVMAPHALSGVGSAFGKNTHYDQFGRVHGRLRLHGEDIAIDCIAMRDRSWGPRPEHRPRTSAYTTGAFGADAGFLIVADSADPAGPATHGFVLKGGRAVALQAGARRVERDGASGFVSAIHVSARDAEGEAHEWTGRPLSRVVLNRHSFIDINSLIEWRGAAGATGWGEDQDMWAMHEWAAFRRAVRHG